MRFFTRLLLIGSVLMLGGCSQLLQIVNRLQVQKPTAKVESAKLTSLSFSDAQMAFRVRVNNPNGIKINMAGLDYNLDVNSHSLVSGVQNNALSIFPHDSSVVTVPVTLNYKKIWAAIKSLSNKEKSFYNLSLGLSFDLPVLGKVRIPVKFKGQIPLLKMPKIQLKGIRLNSFSWSGANLMMDIRVKSMGGIPLLLKGLNYRFSANGMDWISGRLSHSKQIKSAGETVISVPFKLNFIQMGRAVYNIIANDAPVDYALRGRMKIGADNPLLKPVEINFDDISKIKISK